MIATTTRPIKWPSVHEEIAKSRERSRTYRRLRLPGSAEGLAVESALRRQLRRLSSTGSPRRTG